MDWLAIRRAIISVTDKTGAVDLAKFLAGRGVEIVSTGGTARALSEAGVSAASVSEITGFPEILGGRVKTLHPAVHAGILADKDEPEHLATLARLAIKPFDLVCVNLYDFSSAIERRLSLREAAESIDIGGPCMLRAAAKNFRSVLALPSPQWYKPAMEELAANDMKIGLEFRQAMASRAFETTSRYDALISSYLRPE